MPLWSIVAILALTCAQCSSVEGATLKIGMMPYTFEPIIRYDPTKPPPNLEQPIDGLYKRFWETVIKDVYDYDSVQFVPIMEYMTLQDTIGFLTPYLRSGAIDVLVDPASLLETATGLATMWSSWGPHTKEATKHLLHVQTDNDFSTHLDHERTLIEAAGTTEAFKEGVAAFLEKRRPSFD